MNTITNDINKLDTQSLPEEDRQSLVDSCRSFIRKAEASASLSDALAAEQPDFTGFERFSTQRLRAMFSILVGQNLGQNLGVVQELDILTIVTLGLCLSTTKVKRMEGKDLSEVIEQATALGSRLKSTIYTDNAISIAIQGSGNSILKKEFNQRVGEFLSSMVKNHYVFWNGLTSFAETVPHGHKFERLTAFALQKVVTVYLPLSTTNDCGIRMTTLFSDDLLINLFGYQPEVYEDRVELPAVINQVAPILGEDVFNSVKATNAWEGAEQLRTSCVKAVVHGGHIIVIDVLVTRHDAVALVNSGTKNTGFEFFCPT